MSLFSKKETTKVNTNENARVKVYGTGCTKCKMLEENARKAQIMAGQEESVGHIYDMETIVSMGIMSTPALAVDGKIVSSGKLLSPEQIREIL